VRGRLALAAGDPGAAVGHAEESGRVSLAAGDVNPAVVPWRSDGALAWLAAGEREAAVRLADAELRLARGVGTPRALGVALRVAGTARGDAGLTAEACAVLETSPARLQHAHALAAHGELELAADRRGEAREPLRRALDIAHRCGAVALAERTHTALRRAGARPRRRVLDGVEALTPAERRICSLAADGLSNRAIAQSQFVATRTVEYHLANAYRKLGVRSRRQLASVLGDGESR
jgi:DNA-binding CsgD family transcriptional regulator